MNPRIASSYARALFSHAATLPAVSAVVADLESVVGLIRDNPALARAVGHPAVTPQALARIIEELGAKSGFGDQTRRFLQLLANKGRLGDLSAIAQAVREELNRRQGVAKAEVRVAEPIGEIRHAQLAAALSKISDRKVELDVTVDPELLGGFRAKVGSTVYDASLRGQLKRLADRLAEA